jgi:hypothetical protein
MDGITVDAVVTSALDALAEARMRSGSTSI